MQNHHIYSYNFYEIRMSKLIEWCKKFKRVLIPFVFTLLTFLFELCHIGKSVLCMYYKIRWKQMKTLWLGLQIRTLQRKLGPSVNINWSHHPSFFPEVTTILNFRLFIPLVCFIDLHTHTHTHLTKIFGFSLF